MIRDPLYRAIEKRLGQRLDHELFERCAVALLRGIYPGLVPIRGGSDGGMDGAIADPGGGPPIPLVVTTRKDVIGNFTKNAQRYRNDGGKAREAVVATSQALTPQRRRNLEKRAQELGFVLRNIRDRSDFADRLYRTPKWRMELLGLPGTPSALSALPRHRPPWSSPPLLGRDRELDWLRRADGDVIVSGQPGVGKTAILAALAKKGHGLFAVSTNIGKIADDWRELRPKWVFVEDIHLDAANSRDSLLSLLLRCRHELGMKFRVCVTTWPSRVPYLQHDMHASPDRVLVVEPLGRDVVAQIVMSVDGRFLDHDDLVGEILDQSGGQPGLAVILAHSVLRGEQLVRGEPLLTTLEHDLDLSSETLDLMAAFALGGHYGMTMANAARAVDTSESRVRSELVRMRGTGVLREIGTSPGGAVAIEPATLRHALVARTYFSGPMSLKAPVDYTPDATTCTQTLIGALARGHQVPHALVQQRLEEHQHAGIGADLWPEYAWTGPSAVRWIFDEWPHKTSEIARAALEVAPGRALRDLVPIAAGHAGTEADSEVAFDHVRRWMLRGQPGAEAVQRRKLVLDEIGIATASRRRDLFDRCNDDHADSAETGIGHSGAAQLVLAAFDLRFVKSAVGGINEKGFKIDLGTVTAADVEKLAGLWPRAVDILRELGAAGVECARDIVGGWFPGPRRIGEPVETTAAARGHAVAMLPDVVELADHDDGIVEWARRLRRRHGAEWDGDGPEDLLLAKLFPAREDIPLFGSPERKQHLLSWEAQAEDIARDWKDEDPDVVAGRMLYYRRQGQLMNHRYPDMLELVAGRLAELVPEPLTWLEELVDRGAPLEWMHSFALAAVAADPQSERLWKVVGGHDDLRDVCVQVGLRFSDLPDAAVNSIMEALYAPRLRSDMGVLAELPHEWKLRLLTHRADRVRAVVAEALWKEGGKPAGEVGRRWQTAVVECGQRDLLQDILYRDREVAAAYVLHSAAQDHPTSMSPDALSAAELARALCESQDDRGCYRVDADLLWRARQSLTADDRRQLILAISATADSQFFAALVGEDLDLYGTLLRRRLPGDAHLAPLYELEKLDHGPSEVLPEMVRMARKHGYRWQG